MEKILIFVETKGEEPRKASLEILSEARTLSGAGSYAVEAVALGKVSGPVKDKVLSYVDRFVHITDDLLNDYSPGGYARALASYAREAKATLILGGATQTARDFLPRAAVLLGAGVASDVTAIGWSDTPVTFVRPLYGGKVLARCAFAASPGIVTVRPNTFSITPPGEARGEYVEWRAGIVPGQVGSKVIRVEEQSKAKVDLREADIIVSGGRGLKAAENFALLEELAGVLGGTVGATRSVVDAKWRDQEDQVGKSGKTVSPKLYIAAGISGAIHHIMGMDTSKVILAINKDQNAIIFNYADYGIVGDLMEVVPAMTEEIRRKLGR